MNDRPHITDLPENDECSTVRRTLELVGPRDIEVRSEFQPRHELGMPDGVEPASIAEAAGHLRICPQCRAWFRRQDLLEEKIGRICRDVPIPDGLRTRLLSALEVAAPIAASAEDGLAADSSVSVRPAPPFPISNRRRWMQRVALAAAGTMTAGVALWFGLRPAHAKVDLDDLIDEAVALKLDPESVRPWVGAAVPPLPGTMETRDLSKSPWQLPTRPVAIFFFRMAGQRGRTVEGRLLAYPVDTLKNPPTVGGFPAAHPFYRGSGFCGAAWVEGDFAYVCLVQGDDGDLKDLRPSQAA